MCFCGYQRVASPLTGVHLWAVWQQPLLPHLSELITVLSPTERERSFRMGDPHRHQEFVMGRACLRFLLGEYTHQAPSALEISYQAMGKPYLAHQSWQFTLSHSHGLILYAISQTYAVGIDVEYIDRPCAYERLSQRYFGEVTDHLTFWRLWTQREARIKLGTIGEPNLYSWQVFRAYYCSLAAAKL